MDDKKFDEWNELKKYLHSVGRITTFSERQIWWAAVGDNIGIEINGKSSRFSRPVLIYKKFSRYGFFGIPLTTQEHDDLWHVPFEFQGKTSYAVLSQGRTMSISRLYGRALGQISKADFKLICKGFDDIYHFDFRE